MEFGNPIVGNEDLIREAIKSPDFSSDAENGVSGWRIARDGSATFYNLVIGSNDYFIDENGNAVFNSVSADSISLNGESLAETLTETARGTISIVTLEGQTAGYNGTQLLFGRMVIPAFDGSRQYAIGGSGVHFDKQAVTGFTRLTVRAFLNWDAPATTAHTQLVEYQWLSDSASGSDWIVNFRHLWQDSTPGGTDAHIGWYFTTNVNNTSGLVCAGTDVGGGSPGSRLYVEDCGPTVDYTTFNMGTGTAPVQTYTKTYSANGSASFQSDGDNRGVSSCYQGYYSGTNGNQFSMISFPYATIQADLAGATITKTELYLNNNHFFSNSGGTAIIGTHNQTSVSGNHSSSQVNDNLDTETFTYGQAKWFTVTNSIGNAFKNNTAKGIALGPAPSNSQSYYGYFAGNGESGEPQLRITYQK